MNASQPFRRQRSKTNSNMRAPIATLRNPSSLHIRIAQPPHQLSPSRRRATNPPACPRGLPRESITRKSRVDQMESILHPAAMRLRIYELGDNVSKFQD